MQKGRASITSITNTSGAVLGINSYDEYGIPAATNIGRFGYSSPELCQGHGEANPRLPEIGMNYYKARIYSPTLGRFMQTDTIGYGDRMNMYSYVGSDPVNVLERWGM